MNINNLTTANLLMRRGTCQHRLSIQAAKERQLQRAENREYRLRRRQLRFNRCLDAALTTAMVLGYLATVVLLALWLQ